MSGPRGWAPGSWGEMQSDANGQRVTLRRNENVLKWVVAKVALLCKYTKNQEILYLKRAHLMVCE